VKCVDTSVIDDSMNGKAQGGSSIKFLQFSHVAGDERRKAKQRSVSGHRFFSGQLCDADKKDT
jgi:hypothetical protein